MSDSHSPAGTTQVKQLLQQLLVAFNGRPATTAAVGAIADSSDVTTLTKPTVALVAAKSKTAGERTESPACRSQNKHGLNCSSLGEKRVPVSWGAGLIKLCILPDSCTPRHCGMKMQAVTIAVTKLLLLLLLLLQASTNNRQP